MGNIERRQLQYCLLGRINGKRAKGTQRLKYIQDITVRADRKYKLAYLIRIADDRRQKGVGIHDR